MQIQCLAITLALFVSAVVPMYGHAEDPSTGETPDKGITLTITCDTTGVVFTYNSTYVLAHVVVVESVNGVLRTQFDNPALSLAPGITIDTVPSGNVEAVFATSDGYDVFRFASQTLTCPVIVAVGPVAEPVEPPVVIPAVVVEIKAHGGQALPV